MCILTIIALLIGIYVGEGGNEYEIGYEEGYQQGVRETSLEFPTSLDGKFYSTDAAIRSMSTKESD